MNTALFVIPSHDRHNPIMVRVATDRKVQEESIFKRIVGGFQAKVSPDNINNRKHFFILLRATRTPPNQNLQNSCAWQIK